MLCLPRIFVLVPAGEGFSTCVLRAVFWKNFSRWPCCRVVAWQSGRFGGVKLQHQKMGSLVVSTVGPLHIRIHNIEKARGSGGFFSKKNGQMFYLSITPVFYCHFPRLFFFFRALFLTSFSYLGFFDHGEICFGAFCGSLVALKSWLCVGQTYATHACIHISWIETYRNFLYTVHRYCYCMCVCM